MLHQLIAIAAQKNNIAAGMLFYPFNNSVTLKFTTMPRRHDDGIGSHGLEQGGANLGNDYSRSAARDRVSSDPLDNINNLVERDNAADDTDENLNTDSTFVEGDEGGSMPDPETLSTRDDDQAH